jgi:hypothetical protein
VSKGAAGSAGNGLGKENHLSLFVPRDDMVFNTDPVDKPTNPHLGKKAKILAETEKERIMRKAYEEDQILDFKSFNDEQIVELAEKYR